MAPRTFVKIVGLLALIIGFAFLLWPLKPDPDGGKEVTCNNALILKLDDANEADGTAEVLNTMLRGHSTDQAKQCKDTATTRRIVGFPLASVGLIAFVAAVAVRTPPKAAPAA